MSNKTSLETTTSKSGLKHRRQRQGCREDTEQANNLASSLSASEWRATVSDVSDALKDVNLPNDTSALTGGQNASQASEGAEEIANTFQTVPPTEDKYIFRRNEVDEVGGWITKLFSNASTHERPNRISSNIIAFATRLVGIGLRLVSFGPLFLN